MPAPETERTNRPFDYINDTHKRTIIYTEIKDILKYDVTYKLLYPNLLCISCIDTPVIIVRT